MRERSLAEIDIYLCTSPSAYFCRPVMVVLRLDKDPQKKSSDNFHLNFDSLTLTVISLSFSSTPSLLTSEYLILSFSRDTLRMSLGMR